MQICVWVLFICIMYKMPFDALYWWYCGLLEILGLLRINLGGKVLNLKIDAVYKSEVFLGYFFNFSETMFKIWEKCGGKISPCHFFPYIFSSTMEK